MSLIRERLYICYTNNLNKFILRKKKTTAKKTEVLHFGDYKCHTVNI